MKKKPKGYWPKGKARNEKIPDFNRTLLKISQILQSEVPGTSKHGRILSYRGLAEYCGVADSTVRKWINCKTVPSLEYQKRLQDWVSVFKR